MHAFSRSEEIIQGQRVRLRELTRADVDEMAHWPRFEEPDLQWANLDLATARERDAWFERGRSNATRRRFVILDHDLNVIGTIGLRNIDYRYGEGTLGIIIAAHAVDKGYGTDVVQTLVRYAFERMALRKIYLDVAQDNLRARRCYEKCGFIAWGQHRGPEGLPYIDMVLTRDRYRQLQAPAARDHAANVPNRSSSRRST